MAVKTKKKITRSRKKKDNNLVEEVFFDRDVNDILDESMERYTEEVLLRRSLPSIQDGLKPVHRKILYTMHTDKNMAPAPYEKVSSISGSVMGRFHPHGDASINDAITYLSREWVHRVNLLDIEGNNGSVDGDGPAAARYIEARGTEKAKLLFKDISLPGVVPFSLNYKEQEKEPDVLPATWPVLFTNGSFGIAVGMATKIPPHNPYELMQAAIYANKHPRANIDKLMSFVPAPDFPTGGIIIKDKGVREAYETGAGRIVMRGKVEKEKDRIIIREIPFDMSKTDLLLSIAEAAEKAKIDDQFVSIEDYSRGDLDIEVHINLRRGVNVDMIEQFLYDKTKLESAFNVNAYCVHKGRPMQVGLVEYINSFVDFRRDCVRNAAIARIDKARPRVHIVDGFMRMTEFPDEIIQAIKESRGKADAIRVLQDKFEFSEEQATAIATMQLYKISRQDVEELKTEKQELEDAIAFNQSLIDDENALIKEVDKELKETAKAFKKDVRRTTIVDASEIKEVEVVATELKKAQPAIVTVSPFYAQRMTKQMYDNGKDKAASRVVSVHDTNTNEAIVMFTRNGLSMQRVVEDLPHSSVRNAVDSLVKTVKTFTAKDDVVASTTFPLAWALEESEELDKKIIVSVSRLGQVKKNKLKDVLLSFNQKGYMSRTKPYNGLKLSGDEIIMMAVVDEEDVDKITLSLRRNSGGRVTKVNFADLSMQGATGSGTNAIKMTKKNDFAVITTTNIDKVAKDFFLER